MDLNSLTESTLLATPEILIITAALFTMICAPLNWDREHYYKLSVSLLLIAVSFVINLDRFISPAAAFGGSLEFNSFSAFFNSIFLVCAAFAIIVSRDYLNRVSKVGEFYSLILLSTSGMMILASSQDLMSLFLSFEIMSLTVFILSGFNRKSVRSTEAGIKYLILGVFSSAILLYGIALLYGASGSIFLEAIISGYDTENPFYLAGTALVLAGFIFKIGAFPLHQWVPDIYQGAPVPVTGFMSVAVKAAAFAILLKFILTAVPYQDIAIVNILIVVSVLTMTIGNITAIVQKSIKRMLAYSSIAHAGYILVGVTATVTGEPGALPDVLYYLYAYTLMNLGAFAVITYLSNDNREADEFERLSGLWNRKPLIAVSLAVFMFSLIGIPPTIGFFAKYKVFLSAVNAGLTIVVIIAILNSVVSAYYYLKVLIFTFMKEDIHEFRFAGRMSQTVIVLLALATVVFGIFPSYTVDLVSSAGNILIPAD